MSHDGVCMQREPTRKTRGGGITAGGGGGAEGGGTEEGTGRLLGRKGRRMRNSTQDSTVHSPILKMCRGRDTSLRYGQYVVISELLTSCDYICSMMIAKPLPLTCTRQLLGGDSVSPKGKILTAPLHEGREEDGTERGREREGGRE